MSNKAKYTLLPGWYPHNDWNGMLVECPSCGNIGLGRDLKSVAIEITQDLHGYKCTICNFYALQNRFKTLGQPEDVFDSS